MSHDEQPKRMSEAEKMTRRALWASNPTLFASFAVDPEVWTDSDGKPMTVAIVVGAIGGLTLGGALAVAVYFSLV